MSEKRNSIFQLDEFRQYQNAWDTRLQELSRRKSYYDGSIYRRVRQGISQLGVLGPGVDKLYGGIKPLYLPLSRAVDVDAGIIPGGWQLAEDVSDQQAAAVEQVFDWSKWNTDGVLFVHYGAQMGVSGLKISDLRNDKRVVVKPVSPLCFLLIPANEYDSTPALSFYVEERIDETGGTFEYAEVIDPVVIRTFKNGTPQSYGSREAEIVNEVKFVPYVEVRHIETGAALGECTFQKSIDLLDEVNQLASYLADIIKKHSEPQWAAFGVDPSDLTKSGDSVWFFPGQNSDAKPLVAQVDISGVLAFIQEIAGNVKEALPELAFDDLRQKDQIATATLELQLMELVLKVKRSRPNYDDGLAQALRLAGKAAKTMDIADLAVLDDEALSFDQERAIIPMDPKTAMELELQELVLERERSLTYQEGVVVE